MTRPPRSDGQNHQQRNRDRSGRYQESAPCELCGRPAGHGYWSLATSSDGVGLTLCTRKRCAAGLTEADIRAAIIARRAGGMNA